MKIDFLRIDSFFGDRPSLLVIDQASISFDGEAPKASNCVMKNWNCNKMPFNWSKYKKKYFPINDSREKLGDETMELMKKIGMNIGVIESSTCNKLLGLCHITRNNEKEAINYLMDSHALLHRQQVSLRSAKTEIRDKYEGPKPQESTPIAPLLQMMNCKKKSISINEKLSELPSEWYMLQITQSYRSSIWSSDYGPSVQPLHVIILPTGKNASEPFSITLPKPDNSMFDLCRDLKSLLDTNKTDLQAEYRHHDLYWKMREKQNNRMMTIVKEIEYTWLREWRILFIADSLETSELTRDLVRMIDKLISDERLRYPLPPKTIWLLRKVATTSGYISKKEISRLIKFILPDHQKLAKNIQLSIFSKLQLAPKLREEKRKTTIFIVDEDIDYLPFEAMEIMRDHPVTRFPSFHVVYTMFKEHEDKIERGCKIIEINEKSGIGIVNPSNNLPKMEKRLRIFMDYWLPKWRTIFNKPPEEEEFADALLNHEIFMYNGHGNGIQYLPGERIEKLRVKSAVLLFGCSSVKLIPIGGRFPPYGVANQYLTASSPCTLGMMWEVTDLDTDKMTACFISDWIPSREAGSWKNVDLEKWGNGKLEFKSSSSEVKDKESRDDFEPEMLRAVAISKRVCSQYMTSAAIVVRGLPVRIKWCE